MSSCWPVSLALLVLALGCGPSQGAPDPASGPVPYAESSFHLEARPPMAQLFNAATRQAAESALARAGVTGRWIRVTDNAGSPLIASPFLPCDDPNAAANEATLKAWVDEIHRDGMSAICWIPSGRCAAALAQHPDWQVRYFGPPGTPPTDGHMDVLSPWGDAFINFCNYAIDRLGLDGVYIDGAFMQNPFAPYGVLASCSTYSAAQFKADTGLEMPTVEDWTNPVFRRWVAWRYQTHATYYTRLAQQIHAAHPNAVVYVNNYHRWDMDWTCGMPLDNYPGDFNVAGEGLDPQKIESMARILRAYGRPQAELWGQFQAKDSPQDNAQQLVQVATSCYVAGAVPAYGTGPGGGWAAPEYAATAAIIAPILNALRPWARNTTLPYAGVHYSQQTETFYFGRAVNSSFHPYWRSLHTWLQGLDEEHVPLDCFFDGSFTPAKLAAYKVVLLPLSFGLKPEQAQALLDYVKGGGVAVLGVAAGQLDAEGEPVAQNPLGAALGFSFTGVPDPSGTAVTQLQLASAGEAGPVVAGMYAPLTLTDPAWSPLYTDAATQKPVVAERVYGAGHVLVAAIDPTSVLSPECEFDNQTSISTSSDTAASGRYSLKFVESPLASTPLLPQLLARVPSFDATAARGGEVHCDLLLEPGAQVDLEFGAQTQPVQRGPLVRFGVNGGHITSGGRLLADMAFGRWIHLDLVYRFAGEGECTYDLEVKGGAEGERTGLLPPDRDYNRTDWLQITGRGGRAGSVFYLDNLQIVEDTNAGVRQVLVNNDFEDGGATVTGQTDLVHLIAARVMQLAPPPVLVTAPEYVRAGVFTEDDTHLLVHLDNSLGTTRQWQAPGGPAATIHCAFPVKSAKLAVTGAALTVTPQASGADIAVPSIGLYQVVEIEKG